MALLSSSSLASIAVRCCLAFLASGILLFLLLTILNDLRVQFIPRLLLPLAVDSWLLGSFGILLLGIVAVMKYLLAQTRDYWSLLSRQRRTLWRMQARQDRMRRLYANKDRYLQFRLRIEQQRLLQKDNHRQMKILVKELRAMLKRSSKSISTLEYRTFRRLIRIYQDEGNLGKLLALQLRLSHLSEQP